MKLSRFFPIAILVLGLGCFSSSAVFAKDEWVKIQSKNFQLFGNASEKEIRGVATKLEQFREAFRQIFPRVKFSSAIPTNVIVFKSDKAFRDYKPINAKGKPSDWVAGYFQTGEDINYIALSTEGERTDTYQTIFHEYVHFLVNNDLGRSNIPAWFNEGLAEYYEQFTIEDDQKVVQTAEEPALRGYAQNTLNSITTFQTQAERIKNLNRQTRQTNIESDTPLTEEELKKLQDKSMLDSIKEMLRTPEAGEQRISGSLSKIECGAKGIFYTVKTDTENLKFTSADFQSLMLMSYGVNPNGMNIGCDTLKGEIFAVITYRPKADAKKATVGEIVSIELVPKEFKLSN